MENEFTTKQENKRRRSDMSSVGTDCETSPTRINDKKGPLSHNAEFGPLMIARMLILPATIVAGA